MGKGLRYLGVAIGLACALPFRSGASESPETFSDALSDEVTVYGSAARSWDSNLYRLPDNPQAYGIVLPPGRTRSDEFTDAGAGIDGELLPAGQSIAVRASVDQVWYEHNTYLNHTAAQGNVTWDWKSGDILSGEVVSSYGRSLAEFVNNREFEKDIIQQQTDGASVILGPAADIDIRLEVDTRSVDHDAEIQKYQDNRKNSGTVSLEYTSSDIETFGLNYRQVRAAFNDDVLSYTDKSTFASYAYQFSAVTQVSAEGGYYQRIYSDASEANFSGATGHLTLGWQATPITGLTLNVFRNLGAYVNNESDYYITDGISAVVAWSPTSTLSVDLTGTYERQNFRGSGIGVLATVRKDNVATESISVKWTPMTWVEVTLNGSLDRRGSTDGYFTYIDRVFGAKCRLIW
jgi:hypothetical protein